MTSSKLLAYKGSVSVSVPSLMTPLVLAYLTILVSSPAEYLFWSSTGCFLLAYRDSSIFLVFSISRASSYCLYALRYAIHDVIGMLLTEPYLVITSFTVLVANNTFSLKSVIISD